LFSSEGWGAVFPPDVLELVTHGGRLYAVPVDIHRTNTLFYNRQHLAEHGLAPPTTLGDLHQVAETLRARGIVPFSIGYKDPWTLTMLAFENVMVAVAGGDYYRDFFSGKRSADDSSTRRSAMSLGFSIIPTQTRLRLHGMAPSSAWSRAAPR